MNGADCPLCTQPGGELVWRHGALRVIAPREPEHPALVRVVWNAHVAEMTDLAPAGRALLMDVVLAVEASMRRALAPDKVNLASLGNLVPHLHWHVIPRWRDDAQFPAPIWAPAQDDAARRVAAAARRAGTEQALRAWLPKLAGELAQTFGG